MTDHCSDCGAELLEGSKFCTECGKTIEQPPAPPVQPQPPQQEEPPKKPVAAPKKKKSRRKLIIGLVAVIAIVAVLVVIFLYLQGSHGSSGVADSRFVGEWEEQSLDLSLRHWTLYSNSTFVISPSISPLINGTWKVSGNQLCLYYDTVCYTFVNSSDGNLITLNRIGQNDLYPANIVLTKKGLQGTSQTPDIECSIDSSTNRVIIDSIDPNVKWSDIRIQTVPTASWQVQDINQKGLARIDVTATILTFVEAGDSILVLDAVGDVTVTMTFLPTNALLGNWTVNL